MKILILAALLSLISCKKKKECWSCRYNCGIVAINRDTTICDPNFDPNNAQFIDRNGNDCSTYQCTKEW